MTRKSNAPSTQVSLPWGALAKPLERRRTPRRALETVVRVYGCSPEDRPFYEDARTLSVSALGARLVLTLPVSHGQKLLIVNEALGRTQVCRVVGTQSHDSGSTEVSVAFSIARAEFWPNLFAVVGDAQSGDHRLPRLAVGWTSRHYQFLTNIWALLRWPIWPKRFQGDPYFRDCWITQPLPLFTFLAALALHVVLVIYPPPIWNLPPARITQPSTEKELTWYDPVHDLPAIVPQRPIEKPPVHKNAPEVKPEPIPDTPRPRQTIITEPLHVTHPRQTLIQLAAPPEAPKFLPALPNIVQLESDAPARPQLQLSADQLAALRPKVTAQLAPRDADAPEVAAPEKQVGPINIASSTTEPAKPVLPVNPMSAPRAAEQKQKGSDALPEVVPEASADAKTLIALSATPAAVPPPPVMPAGNLAARISVSSESPPPGAPTGAEAEKTSASGGSAGSHVPDGIFVSVGRGANPSPVAGLGLNPALREGRGVLPARVAPPAVTAPADARPSPSGLANLSPGAPPEAVLGSKHVYTLHVNMPNLTSATGSWILNFAELDAGDVAFEPPPESEGLNAPVPLRKVDPKYPPELRNGHVDGEVVLYAVIRKDGSVDSIQLVRGLDPILNANAMEALAQWKFHPAEKSGVPVDLEAVVRIPFRSRLPIF